MTKRLTYWDYIKLDEIHQLQSNVQTDSYDEVMFIAIHQHFELWFAQVIRDLDEVISRLSKNPPEIVSATKLMDRVNKEFTCATNGFEIMKTLSRESFLSFRQSLQSASGLQSAQLTIIELLTGRLADEMYHDKMAGPGMEDFFNKYGGQEGTLIQLAKERLEKGTLRTVYDRVVANPNFSGQELNSLQAEIIKFDNQLYGWRQLHYEAAAVVLGQDFVASAGTVGNQKSCKDNLLTGIQHTHKYFEDLHQSE